MDVQLLSESVLESILNVQDIRKDERVEFIGGIRGLSEIEKKGDNQTSVGFAMYPVKIDDLLGVAENDDIMPPKSTWMEPKPRSGFVVRRFSD